MIITKYKTWSSIKSFMLLLDEFLPEPSRGLDTGMSQEGVGADFLNVANHANRDFANIFGLG